MHQDAQVAMIHRLFGHIDAGTTSYADTIQHNPITRYTCAEQFSRERQVLFRETPLLLGLSARIANPGDYVVEDVDGLSILLVRDREGGVRAYHNICRHRAAPVATGAGNARRFTCPYHAWTYGLDGALKAVPDADSFDGICKAENGLFEVPAAERHGLIFVRPGGGAAIDVDQHLAGLEDDVSTYDFDTFHHYRSLTIERQMNWKLCPETFMEGYHLQYLHRNSVGSIFHSNLMVFDHFGPHSRLTLPRQRIANLRDKPESDWHLVPETAMIYTFFPNVTLVVQAGHVEMWRSYPADGVPGASRVQVSVFTPEAVEAEKARAFYEKNIDLAIRTVDGEDFPLSEHIQTGHGAGAHDAVIYGRNEPALIHYHQSLVAALTG
ncbi:MAG: SRPBCC family protein [Minwuia sp.]|nr:SRPBCC family protein [Minwuia sp.]